MGSLADLISSPSICPILLYVHSTMTKSFCACILVGLAGAANFTWKDCGGQKTLAKITNVKGPALPPPRWDYQAPQWTRSWQVEGILSKNVAKATYSMTMLSGALVSDYGGGCNVGAGCSLQQKPKTGTPDTSQGLINPSTHEPCDLTDVDGYPFARCQIAREFGSSSGAGPIEVGEMWVGTPVSLIPFPLKAGPLPNISVFAVNLPSPVLYSQSTIGSFEMQFRAKTSSDEELMCLQLSATTPPVEPDRRCYKIRKRVWKNSTVIKEIGGDSFACCAACAAQKNPPCKGWTSGASGGKCILYQSLGFLAYPLVGHPISGGMNSELTV